MHVQGCGCNEWHFSSHPKFERVDNNRILFMHLIPLNYRASWMLSCQEQMSARLCACGRGGCLRQHSIRRSRQNMHTSVLKRLVYISRSHDNDDDDDEDDAHSIRSSMFCVRMCIMWFRVYGIVCSLFRWFGWCSCCCSSDFHICKIEKWAKQWRQRKQ